MTVIKVVRMYSKLLEESKVTVKFIRNGKEFYGPLFSDKDIDERVTRNYAVKVVDTADEEREVIEVINTYKDLCKEYGIKTYDSTERTMKHWQYVNGFSDILMI